MRVNKNIKARMFALGIFLSLLCITVFATASFAAPGIKITKPINGSTVTPGQEITITIEAVDGFVIKQGIANIARSPLSVNITSLPFTFTDKIPVIKD